MYKWAIYTMAMLNNQRVDLFDSIQVSRFLDPLLGEIYRTKTRKSGKITSSIPSWKHLGPGNTWKHLETVLASWTSPKKDGADFFRWDADIHFQMIFQPRSTNSITRG
jgi:hypothetical protein